MNIRFRIVVSCLGVLIGATIIFFLQDEMNLQEYAIAAGKGVTVGSAAALWVLAIARFVKG